MTVSCCISNTSCQYYVYFCVHFNIKGRRDVERMIYFRWVQPSPMVVYSMQHHVINLSVTCYRSVVFSGSNGLAHHDQ